jgi:hypothetical protein
MSEHRNCYGPDHPATYVAHNIPEQRVDLSEIEMNYARVGSADAPALLLVPGQSESWWGYEAVMPRLAEHFEVFAVDCAAKAAARARPVATRSTTWATISSASSTSLSDGRRSSADCRRAAF